MEIVDRKIVLSLNVSWQVIGVRTVADAFIAMMGGTKDTPPVKALDITYERDEKGNYDFDSMPAIVPVTWMEWIALPIREYDLVVNTSKHKIRVPTVTVSLNYSKIPKKRFHPSKSVLYDMQKGVCGYSGQKISAKHGNLEHKIARSHGGKNTFENLMFVKTEINSKRGNKPLAEAGLRPLFHHKEPNPIPISFTFKISDCIDWKWFF